MAIIYSYPTKATPVGADMVLITDSESTNPKNQTAQATIASIQNLVSGVSTINGLAGVLTLTAGSNIAFTTVGNDISIASTGGGSGTVTEVTANTPLSVTNGTTTPDLTIAQSNGTTNGYLSSEDWTTFNSKTANTGTVTTVSSTTAGDALAVAVTNASTTPAIALSWAGTSSQYIDGAGSLTTFPTIPANTNIANTQLTLETNRILALSSYSLTFTGTNLVQFSNQGSARNLSVLVDNNLEVDGQAWVNSYAGGESTGTVNVDWNDGNIQEFTLSGVTAWTCTNQKAGGTYIMIVNQAVGQSYTQSFSQSFDWADGNVAPGTTTAERADVYSFVCRTTSGSMLGTFSQNFI
jgi:hypothetical protein